MPTVSEIQKRVEFLKDLAEEEDQDIIRIAKDRKISNHSQMLEEVAGIAGAAYQKNKQTWAQDVADYYNVGLDKQGDLLTPDDVHGLEWVIDRYANKLIKQQPPMQSYSTMSTNNAPPYSQPPVQLPPADPRSLPEAELLRSFLLSNYNPRGHLVNEWIENQFKPHYEYLVNNPMALNQILRHNFASAGQIAFDLWVANKQRVSMDPYGQQMGMPQQPYAGPMGTSSPYLSPMGSPSPPIMTREEQVDNDRWSRMEKMINRTMQMKYMEMMNGMAGGNQQQPPLPPGIAYQTEDVIDHNNRPTGAKRYVPVQIGGQQNQQENRLMEVILQGMQSERNILLQKVEGPNNILEKIATTALASHHVNTDPFEAFSKMLSFSQQLQQQRGQPETKGLDVLKTEIDAKLALAQLNLAEKKEEREYNREIESERASNDNMKMYIDSIKDVMTKVLSPAVTGMMQGYLQPPGMQAQQAQQMAPPPEVQQPSQEEYAMQQQQIMQQRQMELQAAQIRQQQAKLIEAQRQQQRPVEEAIAERTDGQLEQDFVQIDNQRREMERIFQKVAAERAKRRLTRSGGIATRATQQQMYAPPEARDQTFEERIAAGEQAANEETGELTTLQDLLEERIKVLANLNQTEQ